MEDPKHDDRAATQICAFAARGIIAEVTKQLESVKENNKQLRQDLEDIALQHAATNGHSKLVKTLLKRGAQDTPRGEDREFVKKWSKEPTASAIRLAARAGYTDTVKILLRYQRRLPFWPWRYFDEKGGWTAALHEAAGNGNFDTVKVMLDEGVSMVFAGVHATSPNLKGHGQVSAPKSTSALYLAAENGHLDIVRLLIRRGVKAASLESENALHFAASGGHPDVVLELLGAGWAVNHEAFYGVSPTYIAALCGHRPVFELLVEHSGKVTDIALSRLEKLVNARNGPAVGMLLSQAPEGHFQQGDFRQLAKQAARHGDAESLRHVLEYGARYDKVKELNYRDMFFSGVANSDETVVKVLIDCCPWTTEDEAAGIHYYMYEKGKMGHLDAILALAEWHGQLNGTNNHNILASALIGAAAQGHVSIAERLIEQQAAEVNPSRGFPPKHQYGNAIVAEYCPLHAAAYHAFDADTCRMLLAHGAQVDTKDPTGMTALLYAAKRADHGASIQIIKALIEQGADVSATTESGDTPLHLAVQCSSWTNSPSMKGVIERKICRVARTLLKGGADINARNKNGRTPLHLARLKGMYIWLQERGPDETIRDNDGLLPKEYFDAQEEKRSRAEKERRLNNPARQKFGPAASLELEWDEVGGSIQGGRY